MLSEEVSYHRERELGPFFWEVALVDSLRGDALKHRGLAPGGMKTFTLLEVCSCSWSTAHKQQNTYHQVTVGHCTESIDIVPSDPHCSEKEVLVSFYT